MCGPYYRLLYIQTLLWTLLCVDFIMDFYYGLLIFTCCYSLQYILDFFQYAT
jgi:hypothetical protein